MHRDEFDKRRAGGKVPIQFSLVSPGLWWSFLHGLRQESFKKCVGATFMVGRSPQHIFPWVAGRSLLGAFPGG